ncbi:MAG: AraC family transcriptional regulator [Bacteroidales bacterium]
MELSKYLLEIVLHFTPFTYLLCALLLILRRGEGNKSRIILAVSFIIWGILMLGSVFHHYKDTSNTEYEIFSMSSLNITLFAFFVMLAYPIEIIKPGFLNLKSISLLLSPWILLNIILLVTKPNFIRVGSLNDIYHHIGEYNVWLRIVVSTCMLFISLIIAYLPNRTKSLVNIKWIQMFCIGVSISVCIYIYWLFTNSVTARFTMQIYCLAFCIILTYQEIYLRMPLSKCYQPLPNNEIERQISILNNSCDSPLWRKFTAFMEKKAVWRNPDLTLVELASMMGTNRTTLSNYIQKAGYDGFYAMINGCRTKDFINTIENQEINGIYETFFDVGFRSKATALRYFRKETGTTPSEYLQKSLLKKRG